MRWEVPALPWSFLVLLCKRWKFDVKLLKAVGNYDNMSTLSFLFELLTLWCHNARACQRLSLGQTPSFRVLAQTFSGMHYRLSRASYILLLGLREEITFVVVH